MKYSLLWMGLLAAGLNAGEIFVNGQFALDRRGQAMLWSRIIGNKADKPHGKLTVKPEENGVNVLKLEAYGKEAMIYSNRPVRVNRGDKIILTCKVRGKGIFRTGLLCYVHQADGRFGGTILAPRKELTSEWEEVKTELTIRDFKNVPTGEFRVFLSVAAGGTAEIRNLSVQGDLPTTDPAANASFEYGKTASDGLFPWVWNTRFGAVKVCTEDVPDGKRCLMITSDPTKKAEPMYGWDHFTGCHQELAVKPDTVYTVSGLMKSEIESGAAGFGFQFLDQYSRRLPQHPRPLKYFPLNSKLKGNGWVPVSYSFKTPAECSRLKLFVAGDNFTGKFYADKIQIQEGSYVPQIPLADKVDESAWDKALCFEDFIQVGNDQKNTRDFLAEVLPSEAKTRLKLLTDAAGNLHLRVIAAEPRMQDRILLAKEYDGKPYNDDSIEIFIDPSRDRQNFYQIAVSSAGVVYDAVGNDKKWNSESLKVKVKQEKDRWIADVSISFLDLGYGEQEFRMPDKKIGLAVFRNRKLKDRPLERSSFQQWAWPMYQDAKRFCPMEAGVKGITGDRMSFLYHSVDSPKTSRPRQAWKTEKPLYEELMGDKRMHPDQRIPVGDCEIGRLASGNQNWNSSAFALRSGMKYHFSEIFDLAREMRISVEMLGAFAPHGFTSRMVKKYPFAVEWYMLPQLAGGRKSVYPGYCPDPKRPYYTYRFIADERVSKNYCDELEKNFRRFHKQIAVVPLGHESHSLFFRFYDGFRKAYLEKEPEVWAKFEQEAKQKYGFGKIGFPVLIDSATPYERIVFQRWFLEKYNQCMKDASARLKKIKPEVVILSEIEVGNFAAMLYENAKGTYDYITQQQVPSGSPNRQNIGFGVKIMGDLAETPVRGGAHVEHYFFSLNGEEVNEILSEVFRAGGKSLALWLIDWYGKTYTDYYGAPERFAEIRHIFKEIGKMRELRFPSADTAVLFSNATRFAENWWFVKSADPNAAEYEAAFTVLGPRAGSWFRFVSDVQIAEQKHPLDSYKTIYVPSARYQDEATVNRLKEYAARGGTLIIGSPDMFELSDDGSRRPSLKKELMGLEVSGNLQQSGGLRFENLNIAASGNPAWKIKPVGKAEVIGRFSSGEPAVIANPYGKGKVITFASNPFSFILLTDRNSWQMFRNIQRNAGCKLDQPIWRFRFPRPAGKPDSPWPQDHVCLTGNACAWELESIVDGPNAVRPFTASYSLAPDLIPDKQKNCGALFNRRKALDAPRIKREKTIPALQSWAAGWKNRKPFAVRINFQQNIAKGMVKLWCHGDIPSIEFYAKVGDSWVKAGQAVIPASAEDVDVREIAIPFTRPARNFEVRFGPREKGDFFLGEMEVWEKKPPRTASFEKACGEKGIRLAWIQEPVFSTSANRF